MRSDSMIRCVNASPSDKMASLVQGAPQTLVAEIPVLAVPWDCHWCTSQVGLDCYQGATGGTEGHACPHMCWWEALCVIIFISW